MRRSAASSFALQNAIPPEVHAAWMIVRRKRYPIRSGDTVWCGRERFQVKSVQHYGEYIALQGQKKSRKVSDVTNVCRAGGQLKIES